MSEPVTAPAGSWASPITAELVARAGISVSSPLSDSGDLYWLEGRPAESGRVVLVRSRPDGATAEVTPPGFSARTSVHEYGGGAYLVDGGRVVFSNWEDQRLWRRDGDDAPLPITPETPTPRAMRYADGRFVPGTDWLVSVRESHGATGRAAGTVNDLVVVPGGGGDVVSLVSGRDFFAAPRPSPDGSELAWISWDHPRMPWDGTELWVAPLVPDGRVGTARLVAGGPGESVLQPQWDRDGRLWFVSDRSGWWNLYRDGEEAPVVAMEAEFADPPWVLGTSSYAPLPDGTVVCTWSGEGRARIAVLDPPSRSLEVLDLPFTAFEALSACGSRVLLVAGSAVSDRSVVTIDTLDGAVDVVWSPDDHGVEDELVSRPEPVTFPSAKGREAHALYYAPRNPDYVRPPRELPPLMVVSHGGPTSAARCYLNLAVQYWTSRGFAVVDVDYGGSTGYGRDYRQLLDGEWGVVDVEDCVAAATWLVDRGRADPARVVIRGGSAGGFTTLAGLTQSDRFAAGASYYGVADLEALAVETHKFESRYLDGLIGPYPAARDRYLERSPVHHLEDLSCPVILFQGLEDEIVPPDQAEAVAEALSRKGLPYAYLAFEGEQHGFRKAETIITTLEAELSFYGQVLGFEPAGDVPRVQLQH
jgi:dipeptidyl aminopeptidase/acylaminoacyl peptidase